MKTPHHPVLVVDDDPDIREAMTAILEGEGYTVSEARDGAEALALLRGGNAPCLILLDLMMPVMDGWSFRAAQLADPALAEIPVVILSAAADVHRQAEALHVDGFLAKPLNVPKPLDTIDTVERHV